MDGQALYYGMNALSNNVIMADRKKLKSANGMYLGSTGSGKSFAAKRELINVFLATNDRIIVVDPRMRINSRKRKKMTKGARSEIVRCEQTHQTILRDLPSQSG